MSFLNELKRRNVIRVAAGYVVVAWLVVQVVETIFPAFGFGDEAIRFVVIGFAVGFIPVVVLAWVFEWTPEGIKKDEGDGRRGPLIAAAAKRWDRIVMVILAIAVAYFLVERIIERDSVEPTIAVLPFTVLGTDEDHEYLAVGIAEDVRSMLAQVGELRVTWHVSSYSPRLNGLEIKEIAESLDVAHLVTGTVRRQGDSVRISSQLIDARRDEVVWAQTFDRELHDVFDVQAEIAGSIVSNLHVEILGPMPVPVRTDPEVLALVVKAAQVFFDGYSGEWEGMGDRMAALLDRAIELDPEYAPSYAWYAYAEGARAFAEEITEEEELRRRIPLFQTALAIDPEEPMILQQLGWSEAHENHDLEAAAPYYERALRSGSDNAEVLRMIGRFAYLIDRYDAANRLLERSAQINPLCTSCIYHLSRSYMVTGRYKDALAMRERYFLLIGGSGRAGFYHYGLMKLLLDDAEGALEVFSDPARAHDAGMLPGKAMALHSLGRHEESDRVLTELESLDSRQALESRAEVHAWRGELDTAYTIIDEIIGDTTDTDFNGIGYLGWLRNPQFRELHKDRRWDDLRARLGWPEERMAAIEIDFSLPGWNL